MTKTGSKCMTKTGSGCITKTGSKCMTEKRNDSDSAIEVDVAMLASLLDFSYKAHLSLLLHFALIWPFTPHPWHMTWLFQLLHFLLLPFPRLECRPRPFFVINSVASRARPRALRRRVSKDRRWVTMLATVSAFSVSSSVDAKVHHSSIFGRLHMINDSTSPAMDQSRPEPSSPVQVQSKKFLDWDRTNPRCWQTGLGLVRTDPSRCPGLGHTFLVTSLLMGKIYLDGAEYTDRSGIILIRVGIRGWVVIKSEDESCFR